MKDLRKFEREIETKREDIEDIKDRKKELLSVIGSNSVLYLVTILFTILILGCAIMTVIHPFMLFVGALLGIIFVGIETGLTLDKGHNFKQNFLDIYNATKEIFERNKQLNAEKKNIQGIKQELEKAKAENEATMKRLANDPVMIEIKKCIDTARVLEEEVQDKYIPKLKVLGSRYVDEGLDVLKIDSLSLNKNNSLKALIDEIKSIGEELSNLLDEKKKNEKKEDIEYFIDTYTQSSPQKSMGLRR